MTHPPTPLQARIESQMNSGSVLISKLDRPSRHRPPGLAGAAPTTTDTWIGEYNFPALLSRCKFPKVSDALHELRANRSRQRNPMPDLPGLGGAGPGAASGSGSGDAALALEVRREMFIRELKHSNNRSAPLLPKHHHPRRNIFGVCTQVQSPL